VNSHFPAAAAAVAGRIDEPRFQLAHALGIAILLHLLLLLMVSLFPEIFAAPRLINVQEEPDMAPVKFTFIDVPDDNVVEENADADLVSDKDREESGPTPTETTPEGTLPPSEGNTPELIQGGAPPAPQIPPSPPVQQLPRVAPETPPEPEPAQEEERPAPAEPEPPAPDETSARTATDESGPAREDEVPLQADGQPQENDDGQDERAIDPKQKSFSQALDRLATKSLPTDLQAVAPPDQQPPRLQSGDPTQWQFNNPDPKYPVSVGSLSFDSRGADFGPWLAEFHARVLAEWNRNLTAWYERLWREILTAPSPDPMQQNALIRRLNSIRGVTGVVFVVTREGSVIDLELIHPSGTLELDRSVQKTLRNVMLPPLPPDFPDEFFPIRAGFYYGVEPAR
jgi:TonB family protein